MILSAFATSLLAVLMVAPSVSAECVWVMWRTAIPWHEGRGYIEDDRVCPWARADTSTTG